MFTAVAEQFQKSKCLHNTTPILISHHFVDITVYNCEKNEGYSWPDTHSIQLIDFFIFFFVSQKNRWLTPPRGEYVICHVERTLVMYHFPTLHTIPATR